MRRAEMARRRKNLSEKRNEEEKVRLVCLSHEPGTPLRNPSHHILTCDALLFPPTFSPIPTPSKALSQAQHHLPLPLSFTNFNTLCAKQMDTINRLLKKQAPKRRGKISAAEISAQDRGDDSASPPEEEITPANPVFVRWVSDRNGCRVGVPGEWMAGPAGKVFARAVEEVS